MAADVGVRVARAPGNCPTTTTAQPWQDVRRARGLVPRTKCAIDELTFLLRHPQTGVACNLARQFRESVIFEAASGSHVAS